MDEGAKPSRLRRAPADKHGILGIPQNHWGSIQSKILQKAEAQ